MKIYILILNVETIDTENLNPYINFNNKQGRIDSIFRPGIINKTGYLVLQYNVCIYIYYYDIYINIYHWLFLRRWVVHPSFTNFYHKFNSGV